MKRNPRARGGGLLFGSLVVAFLLPLASWATTAEHPLEPGDRSSPRATLRTFLDGTDRGLIYIRDVYVPDQTAEHHKEAIRTLRSVYDCLDLRETPPAARAETRSQATAQLYETLSRIELPPWEAIPDADEMRARTGPGAARWRVPHTDIELVRMEDGPQAGEYVFSAATVARADEFYQRIRDLPYRREVPLEGVMSIRLNWVGWMVPVGAVRALPDWMKRPVGGQIVWKWLAAGVLLLSGLVVVIVLTILVSRVDESHVGRTALARLLVPIVVLLGTPSLLHFLLVQINVVGSVANLAVLVASGVMSLFGAMLAWRVIRGFSAIAVASPAMDEDSVTAHLVDLVSRVVGLIAVCAILLVGSNHLGLPLLGVIASLGVGGLALALAAQPTIENLIGSLNLYADRPVAVGDFCRYGDREGVVESIGLRSTRLRGRDRTVTTIPNSAFSKAQIINYSQRDRHLVRATIGLRYETTPEQMRFVLAELRRMLLAHPRVKAKDLRVRFAGFGAHSLDVEIYAYVETPKWPEYLAIREDIYLRVIDVVEAAGTGFAFPSQTMYMAKDDGLDPDRVRAAESAVDEWREGAQLPFPDFAPQEIKQLRGTLEYPPRGSAVGKPPERPRRDSAPERAGGATMAGTKTDH